MLFSDGNLRTKMPPPYQTPKINASVDIIKYANTVTDGILGTLFTIACFVVIFLIMKSQFYRTSDSLAVSSTLTFILASLLWVMGALQGQILMIFVVFMLGSFLWVMFDNS